MQIRHCKMQYPIRIDTVCTHPAIFGHIRKKWNGVLTTLVIAIPSIGTVRVKTETELNPCPEPWRSQLIWIYTACHSVCDLLSTNWFIAIVWGFSDTSIIVGHFVSSPREREKRNRRDSGIDERRGTGEKEENEWKWRNRIKTFPLYPYLLQG